MSPTNFSPDSARPPSLSRRFLRTLRGLILWRHERGSWQYDVMCILILLFVFATPRHWFHDLPLGSTGAEEEIQVVQKKGDLTHYRIRASLLAQYGEMPQEATQAARSVLARRHGKPFSIASIEPVEDDDGAIVWYDVRVRDARE